MTTPTTSLHLTSIVRRAAAAMLMAACGLTAAVPEAAARRVTPDEALTAARAILPAREYRPGQTQASAAAPLELAHTATDAAGLTDYYVFNRPADEGYVIVSGDTRLRSILAYSDSGTFDPGNIPPAMQAYLDGWQSEIAGFLAAEPAGQLASRGTPPGSELSALYTEWEPVEPLIKSKWSQSAPYNNDCPRVNGNRCLTGCVATAMAQIVRYYRAFNGTENYSYNCDNIGQFLSYDYAGHQFDWDNMLDTYDGKSTAAQKAAVADLMYACGVAVDMVYNTGGSGGYSFYNRDGYVMRFGYDPATRLYLRSDCPSQAKWETMIYTELSNGRPIQYSGRGIEEGHSFILDGTDGNGLYHFNWGWGGGNDGYFALSSLQNNDTNWNVGYTGDQGMTLVVPPSAQNKPERPGEGSYDNDKVTLRLLKPIALVGQDQFNVQLKLCATTEDLENPTIYPSIEFTNITDGRSYSFGMQFLVPMSVGSTMSTGNWNPVTINQTIPAGTYRVGVSVRLHGNNPSNAEVVVLTPDPVTSQLFVDVDASGNRTYRTETYIETDNFLLFENVDFGGGFYRDDTDGNRFRCSVTNTSDNDYANSISYVFTPAGASEPLKVNWGSHVVIPAHDKIDIDIAMTLPQVNGSVAPAGDYILSFTNFDNEAISSQTYPVTIHNGTRPADPDKFTPPVPSKDWPVIVDIYQHAFTLSSEAWVYGFLSAVSADKDLHLSTIVYSTTAPVTVPYKLTLYRPGTKTEVYSSEAQSQTNEKADTYYYGKRFDLTNLPIGTFDCRFVNASIGTILSETWPLTVYAEVTVGNGAEARITRDAEGNLILLAVNGTVNNIDLTKAKYQGSGIESIAANAFKGNTELTSVTIPASVTAIGSNAFRFCRNLRDVTFRGIVPPMANAAGIFYGASADLTFHVPAEAIDAYTAVLADYGNVTAFTEEPVTPPTEPVTPTTLPVVSTSRDNAQLYAILSYRGDHVNGGASILDGVDTEMTVTTAESSVSETALWYFTKGTTDGTYYICNYGLWDPEYPKENPSLKSDWSVQFDKPDGTPFYILPNGVNDCGLVISATNPPSNSSCLDKLNSGVGVSGGWNPSANDWEGTTWLFIPIDRNATQAENWNAVSTAWDNVHYGPIKADAVASLDRLIASNPWTQSIFSVAKDEVNRLANPTQGEVNDIILSAIDQAATILNANITGKQFSLQGVRANAQGKDSFIGTKGITVVNESTANEETINGIGAYDNVYDNCLWTAEATSDGFRLRNNLSNHYIGKLQSVLNNPVEMTSDASAAAVFTAGFYSGSYSGAYFATEVEAINDDGENYITDWAINIAPDDILKNYFPHDGGSTFIIDPAAVSVGSAPGTVDPVQPSDPSTIVQISDPANPVLYAIVSVRGSYPSDRINASTPATGNMMRMLGAPADDAANDFLVQDSILTDKSLWYFTDAGEDRMFIVNKADGRKIDLLSATFNGQRNTVAVAHTDGLPFYILPNGFNEAGYVISTTSPVSDRSCLDARLSFQSENYAVGTWQPAAYDYLGTTWIFVKGEAGDTHSMLEQRCREAFLANYPSTPVQPSDPATATVNFVKPQVDISGGGGFMGIYYNNGDYRRLQLNNQPALAVLGDDAATGTVAFLSQDYTGESDINISDIDHIDFENSMPIIVMTTDDGIDDVYDKTTKHAGTVSFYSNGNFNRTNGWRDVIDLPMKLTGRGNSTLGFPKKPYRIRLEEKVKVHDDLKKAKNYVLLANYKDGTLMRNSFAMEAGRALGIPYTPHAIPCNVRLNDKWKGSYILCEKTGINSGHIHDIDETQGILLELDTNYDPSDTYFEENGNYNIGPFGFPVAIKDPDFAELQEDGTITDAAARIEAWKQKFLAFEKALANGEDWTEHADLESAVRYVMLFNLCGNQELRHPKSVFIHARNIDSKFVFGHMWDFDWAFDGGDLPSASSPFFQSNLYMAKGRDFFMPIISDPRFQERYAAIWADFVANELPLLYDWMGRYAGLIESSAALNELSESSTKPGAFRDNVNRLRQWIGQRVEFISTAPHFGLYE